MHPGQGRQSVGRPVESQWTPPCMRLKLGWTERLVPPSCRSGPGNLVWPLPLPCPAQPSPVSPSALLCTAQPFTSVHFSTSLSCPVLKLSCAALCCALLCCAVCGSCCMHMICLIRRHTRLHQTTPDHDRVLHPASCIPELLSSCSPSSLPLPPTSSTTLPAPSCRSIPRSRLAPAMQ